MKYYCDTKNVEILNLGEFITNSTADKWYGLKQGYVGIQQHLYHDQDLSQRPTHPSFWTGVSKLVKNCEAVFVEGHFHRQVKNIPSYV